MSREAMKLALEAFGEIEWSNNSQWQSDRAKVAITVIKEALAQPEQEPVALFKWLPEGATHIGRISVRTAAGGSLAMTTYAFKYDSEMLKVYVTDNDNEYPGWRDAKDCFFHLNFPVLPLYTSPPAQRPWVGLTLERKMDMAESYFTDEWAINRAIQLLSGCENALKEENGA